MEGRADLLLFKFALDPHAELEPDVELEPEVRHVFGDALREDDAEGDAEGLGGGEGERDEDVGEVLEPEACTRRAAVAGRSLRARPRRPCAGEAALRV